MNGGSDSMCRLGQFPTAGDSVICSTITSAFANEPEAFGGPSTN